MFWKIDYRARFGPAVLKVEATTREEAEAEFHSQLHADDEFGVILRVTPIEGGSAAPGA